mmetsp:Transcript_8484/g.24316  ORF Transcript_8484/g.24316 Transcript_8484/m.24316 type:complete len:579 (-) Transcript_8484:1271-3007(-)
MASALMASQGVAVAGSTAGRLSRRSSAVPSRAVRPTRSAGIRVAARAITATGPTTSGRFTPSVRATSTRGSAVARAGKTADGYDYDLLIIGCGVGGHGAALHAVECGLKCGIIEGHDIGGTCVNRGCVPSKALLAASGRVREMKESMHLKAMGIQVGAVDYDLKGVANHASQLASNVAKNLGNSLTALGVDILTGVGKVEKPHTVSYALPGRVDVGGTVTAKNIIIATGSVPFVPPGIPIDGKTVFTSDHALKLEWLPDWVAIIGSGYIGLEFSDVYTALGSDVTFVEAMPEIMPGFDREIAKIAERVLIRPRNIDYHTNVLATKVTPGVPGVKPVVIELTDFNTKEKVDELEVDACLVATGRAPYTQGLGLKNVNVETDRRGFVPVTDKMEVLDTSGKPVPGLYCIGDANGKYMLAHAASAQGISVVENCCGREHIVNHMSVPAACFTHPEVSFVGMTEDQAREKAEKEGFEVAVAKTSFKANSKALAELESDGMAKMIYNKHTGEILGVHIFGLHAADLIHEASNAVATGQTVNDIKFNVHAHPTLSEVLDELFKQAHTEPAPVKAATAKAAVTAK